MSKNVFKKISPKKFYKKLGAKGLALRKNAEHTRLELEFLKKILKKNLRILDLACGYGRFTIPLAKAGYKIEGLDISPNLLAKAREDAKNQKLNIKFKMGDMRKLPYSDSSFDSIICMWSAFIELTNEKDQITALKEMLRVLAKGGFAFIEIPQPQRVFTSFKTKRKDVKPQIIAERVVQSIVDGVLANPMYLHNKTTVGNLLLKVKPRKYKISIENFGGRLRTLIWIWK